MEATLGGSTRPMLSPWTIISTPMVLVVKPQLFRNTNCFSPVSGFSKVISNILLKFCPKWWEVAPWIDLKIIYKVNYANLECFKPSSCRDVSLNCGGVISSSKLLFLSFTSSHHWNGQQLLIDAAIQIKDGHYLKKWKSAKDKTKQDSNPEVLADSDYLSLTRYLSSLVYT